MFIDFTKMKKMKPREFLYSLVNYEKLPGYHYDLEAYKKFLTRLGSPHKELKNVVLIAGTKGKGSTASMISSCLTACGYRIGLYTSPHLKVINERIKINNQNISDEKFNKYIEIIKPHINLKTKIGARTFFEVLTATAFMHFAEEKVDLAILEVGLGGRLDATNVFTNHIPVITRIGYDHMNLLGNTLSQIAYEKAGIISPSSPYQVPGELLHSSRRGKKLVRCGNITITIHQRPGVEKVLKRIARERRNEIIYADELHRIKIEKVMTSGTHLHINGPLGNFNAFLPLPGRHQIENLLLSLAVLVELKNQGFKISVPAIVKGLARMKIPGRFETICKKPRIIYDVAHNEDSFRALENILREIYQHESSGFVNKRTKTPDLCFIFGCSQDKDVSYAVKNVFPLAEEVLLVKANSPRSMEPVSIYEKARRFQKNLIIAGSVKNAFAYLKTKKKWNHIIIIFGSFYLFNEVDCLLTRENFFGDGNTV